jgi:hypothetical protein
VLVASLDNGDIKALLLLKKIVATTRKVAKIFVNKTFAIFLFTLISPLTQYIYTNI